MACEKCRSCAVRFFPFPFAIRVAGGGVRCHGGAPQGQTLAALSPMEEEEGTMRKVAAMAEL